MGIAEKYCHFFALHDVSIALKEEENPGNVKSSRRSVLKIPPGFVVARVLCVKRTICGLFKYWK